MRRSEVCALGPLLGILEEPLSRVARLIVTLLAILTLVTIGALLLLTGIAGCGWTPFSTPVTYNKHIAPIVYANCVSCHARGADGNAPKAT